VISAASLSATAKRRPTPPSVPGASDGLRFRRFRTVSRMIVCGILEPKRAGGKKSYRFLRRDIELLAETGFGWP
jgi:hypothetical protein